MHELFLRCGSGTLLTSYKTVLITVTIFVFFLLVFVRLEEILEGENVPRATSDTTRRLRSEVNSSFLWYQYHEIISGLSLSLIKVKLGNCTIPEKYG